MKITCQRVVRNMLNKSETTCFSSQWKFYSCSLQPPFPLIFYTFLTLDVRQINDGARRNYCYFQKIHFSDNIKRRVVKYLCVALNGTPRFFISIIFAKHVYHEVCCCQHYVGWICYWHIDWLGHLLALKNPQCHPPHFYGLIHHSESYWDCIYFL